MSKMEEVEIYGEFMESKNVSIKNFVFGAMQLLLTNLVLSKVLRFCMLSPGVHVLLP
jgi:hypothetical protein